MLTRNSTSLLSFSARSPLAAAGWDSRAKKAWVLETDAYFFVCFLRINAVDTLYG